MYFNVNFNVLFFLNKKVQLLVSELYIYLNARCNNNKKKNTGNQSTSNTAVHLRIIESSCLHFILKTFHAFTFFEVTYIPITDIL